MLRKQVALMVNLDFRPLSGNQPGDRDHNGVNRAQPAKIGHLEAPGPATHQFSHREPVSERKSPKRLDFVGWQFEMQGYGAHKSPISL